MLTLNYEQRAMYDAYTLCQTTIHNLNDEKTLQVFCEVVLYRRDDETNISDSDIVGRRFQLAACLALTNRLTIPQLEYIVKSVTGSVPSPINLAHNSTGL
jgi:hypothetical protein